MKVRLHAELPTSLAWVVFALAAANVLAYVVAWSNPVVVADAWYFLGAFLSHVADGTLQASDFFIKRGGIDHAQPLRKLILLLEWKQFAFDLRIQAIIGVFCAGGSLLLLRWLVFWKTSAQRHFRAWMWAGMCVALLSLNARGVWTWPLVAGGFTNYLFVFALLVGIWKCIDAADLRWIALPIVLALLLDFIADDVAILVTTAIVMALLFVLVKLPQRRRKALYVIIALIACLIVVRISYALIFTPPTVAMMPLGTRLDRLAQDFVHGGWWQWAVIPLGSSVTYIVPLRHLFGHGADGLRIFAGSVLVLCHIWFWWQAFRTRPNAAAFAAIAMMLVFYALLAGILYGRIPTFGNGYLSQPRYILAYSMGNVALLLMCAAHDWKSVGKIRPGVVMAVLVAGLVLWQLPASLNAWRAGPYVKAYEQKMTNQLWWMARHDYQAAPKCLWQLAVCRYPQARRAELIGLLQSQHKNVFSRHFQHATSLRPPPAH